MTLRERRLLYRSTAWAQVRRAVLARCRRRCEDCGAPGWLEVHHVVPLAAGGAPLDLDNVRALCRRCHFRAEPGRQPVGSAAAAAAWREKIDGTTAQS